MISLISHIWFQALGFPPPALIREGETMGSLQFTGRPAWSLLYQGQVLGAYPMECYPHLVVPGNAGKSYGSSQNMIFSINVAFTLGSNMPKPHNSNLRERFGVNSEGHPFRQFIVSTKLTKPRPPWWLVSMSRVFIIVATSALKFSK